MEIMFSFNDMTKVCLDKAPVACFNPIPIKKNISRRIQKQNDKEIDTEKEMQNKNKKIKNNKKQRKEVRTIKYYKHEET